MFAYAIPEQKKTAKDTVQKKELENKVANLNLTGIPSTMKAQFENLSGFSFDDVRVHYNSDKPAQLQALAYTQGNQVHISPGQERHLGHELGHVVQQKRGIVQATGVVSDLPLNDDSFLEREADIMNTSNTGFVRKTKPTAQSGVVQRYASITITNGRTDANGASGKSDETTANLTEYWPQMYEVFNSNIKSVRKKSPWDDGQSDGYDRTWSMCAEPNAFSKLVKNLVIAGTQPGAIDLSTFHFKDKAKNSVTHEKIPPCEVCSQWVDSALWLTPPINDARPIHEYEALSAKLKPETQEIKDSLSAETLRDRNKTLISLQNKGLLSTLGKTYSSGRTFDHRLSYTAYEVFSRSNMEKDNQSQKIQALANFFNDFNPNNPVSAKPEDSSDFDAWLAIYQTLLEIKRFITVDKKTHATDFPREISYSVNEKCSFINKHILKEPTDKKVNFSKYLEFYDWILPDDELFVKAVDLLIEEKFDLKPIFVYNRMKWLKAEMKRADHFHAPTQ